MCVRLRETRCQMLSLCHVSVGCGDTSAQWSMIDIAASTWSISGGLVHGRRRGGGAESSCRAYASAWVRARARDLYQTLEASQYSVLAAVTSTGPANTERERCRSASMASGRWCIVTTWSRVAIRSCVTTPVMPSVSAACTLAR